jgi:hypothetical protein
MSRKRTSVEIRVTAGLLALLAIGCVHAEPAPNPVALEGSGTPIPEGVDYLRAIQCGGLLWALQAVQYRSFGTEGLTSMTGLYLEWAEKLAVQDSQDPAFAKPDMAASRDMIIAASGGISPMSKAADIHATYPGDVKACSVMAKAADYDIVIIGG